MPRLRNLLLTFLSCVLLLNSSCAIQEDEVAPQILWSVR